MKKTPRSDSSFYWLPISLLSVAVVVLFILQFYNQPKIVYININKLLLEYQGIKDAQSVLQGKTQAWQANIDTLAHELSETIEKFEKTKGDMSKKEITLNEELIKTRKAQFVQYREAVNEKATQEDQQLQKGVLEKINAFIKVYGEREGYTMILGATGVSNIVYAEKYTDVTDEVLAALNAAYAGNN